MAERKSAKQLQIDEIEQNGKKDEREKALAETFKTIEKTYGKGSVMRLGDVVGEVVEVIPSGSITLDAAMGVGGYPKGRIIEIYGPESSGKTTIGHLLSEKFGKTFVDTDDLIVDKIKEIANFEPKVYTSNTDNFIKGVKNILDEIINS